MLFRSNGDFRTNCSRDARAEAHQSTELETEYALKAADAVGAEIAGIDLLYDSNGRCYVIEVNAVPGWQAFNRANQVDVASMLIAELESMVETRLSRN